MDTLGEPITVSEIPPRRQSSGLSFLTRLEDKTHSEIVSNTSSASALHFRENSMDSKGKDKSYKQTFIDNWFSNTSTQESYDDDLNQQWVSKHLVKSLSHTKGSHQTDEVPSLINDSMQPPEEEEEDDRNTLPSLPDIVFDEKPRGEAKDQQQQQQLDLSFTISGYPEVVDDDLLLPEDMEGDLISPSLPLTSNDMHRQDSNASFSDTDSDATAPYNVNSPDRFSSHDADSDATAPYNVNSPDDHDTPDTAPYKVDDLLMPDTMPYNHYYSSDILDDPLLGLPGIDSNSVHISSLRSPEPSLPDTAPYNPTDNMDYSSHSSQDTLPYHFNDSASNDDNLPDTLLYSDNLPINREGSPSFSTNDNILFSEDDLVMPPPNLFSSDEEELPLEITEKNDHDIHIPTSTPTTTVDIFKQKTQNEEDDLLNDDLTEDDILQLEKKATSEILYDQQSSYSSLSSINSNSNKRRRRSPSPSLSSTLRESQLVRLDKKQVRNSIVKKPTTIDEFFLSSANHIKKETELEEEVGKDSATPSFAISSNEDVKKTELSRQRSEKEQTQPEKKKCIIPPNTRRMPRFGLSKKVPKSSITKK
ncbi:MAG: hypothetical protein EXX96DRAFT_548827 [Benjaminiella poitrasii]|nr:MAG: hypothetical protein EXX96DRAFT_548827 [Benjaminiella poitrasii]